MKIDFSFVFLALCLVVGCSKDPTESSVGKSTPTEKAEDTKTLKPSDGMVAASKGIESDMKAEKFDDVLQTLTMMQGSAKSIEDQRQYQSALYQVTQELQKKAQTDPKARQRFDMLGRFSTGR